MSPSCLARFWTRTCAEEEVCRTLDAIRHVVLQDSKSQKVSWSQMLFKPSPGWSYALLIGVGTAFFQQVRAEASGTAPCLQPQPAYGASRAHPSLMLREGDWRRVAGMHGHAIGMRRGITSCVFI